MNSSAQPLVSVVTPVYNGDEFLVECIESILAQTYQNWDYTIVDNCSTDRSLEIARRYAARDPRIRIHANTDFLPVIENHNMALRQASPAAKYLKVVFSDDWIFPECLEQMVAVAEVHPSVGMVGAYTLEGTAISCTGLPYPSTFVSGKEICRRHLLDGLYVFGSANSLLYRAELIRSRDPFLNEKNIHADTEVCFELLKHSDFGFVHQVLTFTRVRPQSLTALSNDLQTDLPGMLQVLLAHGAEYLSAQELELRIEMHLRGYYESLAKAHLRGRKQQFLDYHIDKLTESAVGYSRARLFKATVAVIADAMLNPWNSIRKLRSKTVNYLPAEPVSQTRKPAAISAKESL